MSAEARKDAIERYMAAVHKNTHEILNLVGSHPKNPANVEALRFVIKTAAAPETSHTAIDILLRDHVRDHGMGEVCGGGPLFQLDAGR